MSWKRNSPEPFGPPAHWNHRQSWLSYTTRLRRRQSMMRLKSTRAGFAAAILATIMLTGSLSISNQADAVGAHPATGVGSCTLKNWNPGDDTADAKDLPE